MGNYNQKDIAKVLVAVSIILSVTLLSATDHEIPTFLVTGFGSVTVWLFGLNTGGGDES